MIFSRHSLVALIIGVILGIGAGTAATALVYEHDWLSGEWATPARLRRQARRATDEARAAGPYVVSLAPDGGVAGAGAQP